jgi:hypothetical protein
VASGRTGRGAFSFFAAAALGGGGRCIEEEEEEEGASFSVLATVAGAPLCTRAYREESCVGVNPEMNVRKESAPSPTGLGGGVVGVMLRRSSSWFILDGCLWGGDQSLVSGLQWLEVESAGRVKFSGGWRCSAGGGSGDVEGGKEAGPGVATEEWSRHSRRLEAGGARGGAK